LKISSADCGSGLKSRRGQVEISGEEPRFRLESALDLADGVVQSDDAGEGITEQDEGADVFGVALEDQVGLAARVLELALEKEQVAEVDLGVGIGRVERDGFLEGLVGVGILAGCEQGSAMWK